MSKPAHATLHTTWKEFRRFFTYTRADLPWYILECVLLLLISASNTVLIWMIGKPFNLIQQHDYAAIPNLAVAFVLLMLFNQFCHFCDVTLTDWLGMRFAGRLRKSLFEKLLGLQHPLALRFERGDLLSRLNQDVWRLHELVVLTPTLVVSALSILLFYATMLVWIDAWLALVALAFSPIYFLHQRLFAPAQRRLSSATFVHEADLQNYEQHVLGNILAVSSFNAAPQVAMEHASRFSRWFGVAFSRSRLGALFRVSLTALIYLTGAIMVALGVYRIAEGVLSPGHLVSFLVFLGYLSVPLQTLANVRFTNQSHIASAARLRELFDLQPFIRPCPNPKKWDTVKGDIAFDQVSFGYPGGKRILSQISLHIDAGETVALVGPSGAGKSTFAQLLLRFYDPDQGSICVDGIDIKELDLRELRNRVSVCWQQGFFLPGTLRSNLRLARPDATEVDMIAACRAAQAWEFIQQLPLGLDTEFLAGGINLSAGQAQRLNLAQVLLRESPILILDEASSALDSDTEKRLGEALEYARAGRTTLLIAHRYSSLRSARRVVYFDGLGNITVGEHDRLYTTFPAYREAVDWQMKLKV